MKERCFKKLYGLDLGSVLEDTALGALPRPE